MTAAHPVTGVTRATPDPILDFDPNGSETPLYALHTGTRLEAKARRGGLITKFSNAARASLWVLRPSGWERLALKHPSAHNDTCTLCHRTGVGAEWAKALVARFNSYGRTMRVGEVRTEDIEKAAWCFERQGRKLVDPLKLHFLCPECHEATWWR